MLSRLQDEGAPMAVMMLDLDHFKQINDRHGHAQGDKVLQQFAQLVQHQLRPDDIFGRLGGEEFALLLPRLAPEQALAVGRRLCEQLRQHAFALEEGGVYSGAPLRVTCSIGLHVRAGPWCGDTLEQWLGKADAALYEAKAAGRDQVRRYHGD